MKKFNFVCILLALVISAAMTTNAKADSSDVVFVPGVAPVTTPKLVFPGYWSLSVSFETDGSVTVSQGDDHYSVDYRIDHQSGALMFDAYSPGNQFAPRLNGTLVSLPNRNTKLYFSVTFFEGYSDDGIITFNDSRVVSQGNCKCTGSDDKFTCQGNTTACLNHYACDTAGSGHQECWENGEKKSPQKNPTNPEQPNGPPKEDPKAPKKPPATPV